MNNNPRKTGSGERLTMWQRQGGDPCRSFYYTPLVTFYEDDMLPFLLGQSLLSQIRVHEILYHSCRCPFWTHIVTVSFQMWSVFWLLSLSSWPVSVRQTFGSCVRGTAVTASTFPRGSWLDRQWDINPCKRRNSLRYPVENLFCLHPPPSQASGSSAVSCECLF